jgi:UDP-N-acetylmuramyl pentapeptide phosphotransferase/UDP-N-acetylglucosamine-1-phosphate transferase
MILITLSFVTAFALSYFAIPSIIRIALEKNLVDEPGDRRSHEVRTPSLGGVAIFAGSIFSITLWTPFGEFHNLQYILCAFIIIFLIGVKDDISPVSPSKKLVAQVLAASILALKSGIMLNSFYGLFGIYDWLPSWIYPLVSIFTILVITNAFNLIDGINGLAGSIATISMCVLGCWFFLIGHIEFATFAFANAGAIMAFLRYNYTPARIFMGDTGALLIGMVVSILVIKFIDLNNDLDSENPFRFSGGPVVAIGIIIIPFFDTLRVFTTRIIRGNSPFKPDRRHIHHLLIDFGCSHMQATGVLVFVNIFFICFVFSMHRLMNPHWLLFLIFGMALVATYLLQQAVNRRRQNNNSALTPG